MNTLTTAALPVAVTKNQEIQEHILPLMDAARIKVREAKMNPVEKSLRCSEILHAPAMEFSIHHDRQDERNALWAEFHAIKEREKESDLTPERRTYLLNRAHEKLPDAERYSFAYQLAKEIEEECFTDFEGPSRTLKALQERVEDRVKEIADYLSSSLSAEDIAFLGSLNGFSRRRDRFRFRRTVSWGRVVLTDIGIRASYAKLEFSRAVERCATVRDVKRVCALWDTPCTVERTEGETVVKGEGFEIHPTK